jgi:hypothetical protein
MAPALVFLVLISGATQTAMPPPTDTAGDAARRRMLEARLAVEGDSASAVMARWSARLAADSSGRAALLGLATVARLANDDTTSTRWRTAGRAF